MGDESISWPDLTATQLSSPSPLFVHVALRPPPTPPWVATAAATITTTTNCVASTLDHNRNLRFHFLSPRISTINVSNLGWHLHRWFQGWVRFSSRIRPDREPAMKIGLGTSSRFRWFLVLYFSKLVPCGSVPNSHKFSILGWEPNWSDREPRTGSDRNRELD